MKHVKQIKQIKRISLYSLLSLGLVLSVAWAITLLRVTIPQPLSINLVGNSSAPLPKPNLEVLSPISDAKIYFNDDTGRMNAEVTPWMLGTKALGGWHTYLISTFDTYLCSTPNNIFNLSVEESIKNRGCTPRTEPGLNPETLSQIGTIPLWRRDYHGVFSAHLIPTANNTTTLYSVNHSESYNNANLKSIYPTLPGCVPVADMGYGKLPCEPKYWWGSYNAWITLSSMPWTYPNLVSPTRFTDLGPITWPSNGYIESLDKKVTWIKATDGGVRHPSSIIKDNYLYIFYEDLSQGSEDQGRGPGIKVMRAPVTTQGINPQDFRAYYKGEFLDPTLPSGFKLPTYYNSLSQKGPRTSNLFPSLVRTVSNATLGTKRTGGRQIGEIISFSVAKVESTPYYLGVAHELNRGITLRLSTDLINWSEPTLVPGTEADWWQGNVDLQKYVFLYPRLANKNGDSNVSINASEFYLLGTQTKSHNGVEAKIVNTLKLKLNL